MRNVYRAFHNKSHGAIDVARPPLLNFYSPHPHPLRKHNQQKQKWDLVKVICSLFPSFKVLFLFLPFPSLLSFQHPSLAPPTTAGANRPLDFLLGCCPITTWCAACDTRKKALGDKWPEVCPHKKSSPKPTKIHPFPSQDYFCCQDTLPCKCCHDVSNENPECCVIVEGCLLPPAAHLGTRTYLKVPFSLFPSFLLSFFPSFLLSFFPSFLLSFFPSFFLSFSPFFYFFFFFSKNMVLKIMVLRNLLFNVFFSVLFVVSQPPVLLLVA